jgi:hypothetical protein
MKKLIALLLIGILITGCIGCIERTSNNIEKENLGKQNWYQYTYKGPQEIENAENARYAVNPYLIELGWEQGLGVVSWRGESNLSIVITIPFQLTNESLNNINQTLGNFSFYPVRLNEVVEMEERPN